MLAIEERGTRTKTVLLLIGFFAFQIQPAMASAAKQGTTEGDLQSNLSVLNLFQKQPKWVNRMYEYAYGVLSAEQGARFSDLAQKESFQRICEDNGCTLLGGPMLGSLTADGARVWVRTRKPAQVEVRMLVDGAGKIFGPVNSTVESDLVAIVPVTGLKPATEYLYQVFVDGKPVAVPQSAAILTVPEATTGGKVRIAFGSCFHRWGLGNPAQAEQIRSRNPAALLLLGDIAVQDRKNHLGLHRADYLMRDLFPAWQGLVARVPVYATWDDHDYFSNDNSGIPDGFTENDRSGVHDVFKQAWNNPSYGFGDERRGVFLRTRIGPCDIIMVDNRYFRQGKAGSFLGNEQMNWLKESLLRCKGPFIILSCGTMWSDYVSDGKDSWGKCDPEGREQLFQFIEQNGIGGVLLISGDRHGARGFRIPRPSGFEFYEFEAASLGGRAGPPPSEPKWTTQFYGIAGTYAFGEFTIDATVPDPQVTFRLIGDNGKVIHELTLKRSQLTPKGK